MKAVPRNANNRVGPRKRPRQQTQPNSLPLSYRGIIRAKRAQRKRYALIRRGNRKKNDKVSTTPDPAIDEAGNEPTPDPAVDEEEGEE